MRKLIKSRSSGWHDLTKGNKKVAVDVLAQFQLAIARPLHVWPNSLKARPKRVPCQSAMSNGVLALRTLSFT